MDLVRSYGRLDGEISARYAVAFAAVAKSLTPDQRKTLAKLRNLDGDVCRGAFLFSDPIATPEVPSTDGLFLPAPGPGGGGGSGR